MSKTELVTIRGRLKYGDLKRIAEALGYSYGHIRNVMAGTEVNAEVIEAAISLGKANEEKRKEAIARLSK